MYFRTKKIKNSKLVQLVESYRNEEGNPRQRVIVSLGDADLPQEEVKQIAAAVERQLKGQREFECIDEGLSSTATYWINRIVKLAGQSKALADTEPSETVDGVVVEEIETEEVVEFGPELVGMCAWDALGITQILQEAGMNGKSIALAEALVVNRLVDPMSEWRLLHWLDQTALPECLNIRLSISQKDQLYRVGDQLHKHRKTIENRLSKKEEQLYGLKRQVVLYDLTNTHFEGLCKNNPKAKHGRNKQKRDDCLQVALGIAYDEFGYPLAHEVFEGNIADSVTLQTMLNRLKGLTGGITGATVILDAGIATKANLELLKNEGYSFVVNLTRGRRTKYEKYFQEGGFTALKGRRPAEQVEVKTVVDPEDTDCRLVLCRSDKRRIKEQSMISSAEKRFLKDIKALQERVQKRRLVKPEKIIKAMGRLHQKHPRIARFYEIEHRDNQVHLTRKHSKIDAALELCGDYVLKTDHQIPAEKLWDLYMQLLNAEEGFKMLKSSLGLRPNFHQKEARVEAHIFISILAYHLLCWIRNKLDQSADKRQWITVRRILRTHSLVTTRLPLIDGTVISIRKPSKPDAQQAQVYNALGINTNAAYRVRRTIRR